MATETSGGLPEGRTASLHLDAATDTTFSALELRDRVVIMLLFDQVVREDQVELAWQLWQKMTREGPPEPLWRVLTLFPELDRDLIYAEAARVYGFEEARIRRSRALDLIHQMEGELAPALWEAMVELRVVPITVLESYGGGTSRVVFAVHDPTRPEVHRLMERLDVPAFELRYAPEDDILNLLIEAFPQRYNYLKGLSGVSKNFLAGVEASEEAPTRWPDEIDPTTVHAVHDLFDEVLEAAVCDQATDVCLLPTPGGAVEVYLQHGDDLRRWRVVDDLPATAVIHVIKQDIVEAEDCGGGRIQKRAIERVVAGHLYRFRVAAVPPSDEVHSECIVVHVYA